MKAALDARPLSCRFCVGLETLFAWKRNTLAAIEDLADGVEDQPEEASYGDGDYEVMVLVHHMAEGVNERGSEPDGEQ
jgi:hypothetical protein